MRAVRFAVGLAVATYVVMTVMVLVSVSSSYMVQTEGLWGYLGHRPKIFLIAAWPSLAMLGGDLVAHGLTGVSPTGRCASSSPPASFPALPFP